MERIQYPDPFSNSALFRSRYSAESIWSEVRSRMELQIPRDTFQMYFRDTEGRFFNSEHGVLGVAAATEYQREFLNGRINPKIAKNATAIVGKPTTCRFTKSFDIATGEKELRRSFNSLSFNIATGDKELLRTFDSLRSYRNKLGKVLRSQVRPGDLAYMPQGNGQVFRYRNGEDVSAGIVVAIHDVGNERHADIQKTHHSQNQWDTIDAEILLSAGTPIKADVSDTVILKELRPRPMLVHAQAPILCITTGGWALVVDPTRPGNHWIPSALRPTDRPLQYCCGPVDHPEQRKVIGQGFVLSDRTLEALKSHGVDIEGRSKFSSVRVGDFVQNDPSKEGQ